jgi:hypothetical protein
MPIKPSLKLMAPLALGGLIGGAVAVFVVVNLLLAWWGRPVFGFGADGPGQPIAFPHDVHVEEKGIQCEFCHRNVTKGDPATVPSIQQCLWCHTTIDGQRNAEIVKLLEFGGLDAAGKPSDDLIAEPIDWERVHRLPDHVQFAHEPHLRFFTTTDEGRGQAIAQAGEMGFHLSSGDPPAYELTEATCSICHGKVREMTKVKQVRDLKMGDCVDCHRDLNAPTDCTTCHY